MKAPTLPPRASRAKPRTRRILTGGMRALALWTGLLPAGLSGCAGSVDGDGGGEPEDGKSEVGKLDFGLIIGDGIALGNVRYTITQLSDGFFQMANVPDSELQGEGFGVYLLLPPALDYHLLIEAEL